GQPRLARLDPLEKRVDDGLGYHLGSAGPRFRRVEVLPPRLGTREAGLVCIEYPSRLDAGGDPSAQVSGVEAELVDRCLELVEVDLSVNPVAGDPDALADAHPWGPVARWRS